MSRHVLTALAFAPSLLLAQVDTTRRMPAGPSMAGMNMMDMSSVLGIGMNRMGSGTAWIPDAVPLPARDMMAGGWNLHLHGTAFAQYDRQGGPRGDTQVGALSWGMIMATRATLGGQLQLRGMLSLDAAGVGRSGYPLLLQTGEELDGKPLHDRQHPHDFFMEVAALYRRAISRTVGVELYVAPSGEPALGPPAFMHRASATDDPFAPIGHHWQDASHISFGVVTAGVFTHAIKLEASAFNGRDPDEHRWGIDLNSLQSYSARFTVNPDSQWSLSAGFGFIRMPEPADATHSMHRFVISAQHSERQSENRAFALTALWGAVAHSDELGLANSGLIEGEWTLDSRNALFGRVEYVQKTAEELQVTNSPVTRRAFDVGSISGGYTRELFGGRAATLGLGARVTVNLVPDALSGAYGSRTPLGISLFLRVRPKP